MGGEEGVTASGDGASLWGDVNAVELDSGDGFMTGLHDCDY